MIWLRATGSTLVSQLIDSFIVLYIAFHLGPQHWPWQMVLAVGLVNYSYKAFMALVLTPVIYLVHGMIQSYFGKELSAEMRQAAMSGVNE